MSRLACTILLSLTVIVAVRGRGRIDGQNAAVISILGCCAPSRGGRFDARRPAPALLPPAMRASGAGVPVARDPRSAGAVTTVHSPATIVAGTDGSASAAASLEQAARIAESEGAVLHVVSAYRQGDQAARARADAALAAAQRQFAGRDLELSVSAEAGDPVDVLVAASERAEVRLLVVGNRGTETLLPWRRAIFEAVQHRARCAVLVVDTEDHWRPPPGPDDRQPRLGREWKVLLVTTLAVFMALLDVTIVNVAFPDIERSFPDTSLGDLSWVLNAYNVAVAALLIPAGRLADRMGRRRVFYSGLYVFVLGSAVCAVAPTVELLIAARVLQAVGAAALIPSSLGLVLPEFAADKRATAVSLWAAAGAVAAAAGPSLGGVLVDAGGWRSAFAVNLVIALGVLPGRRLLVDRRDTEAATASDGLGASLLAGVVGLLALGIVKAPEWGWGDDRVLGAWALAAVLAVLLLVRSRRHPAPVLEPALLRIRSFRVASAATLVYAVGFYALLLANVLFLTQVWGYSVLSAGFGVTPGPLCAAIGAALAGRLVEHRGPRGILVGAALTSAAAFVLYRELPGPEPAYLSTWLPCQIVSGAGAGMVFAALSTATVTDLPANRIATGTALASCLRQIGAVLGIAGLVAVLAGRTGPAILDGFDEAYGLMLVTALATAVLGLRIPSGRGEAIGEAAPLRGRIATRDVPGLDTREALPHGFPMLYREAGSGPPVLLVHGLIDSSRTWRKVAPALALGHRVVAPDLLGHGGSSAPDGFDYSLGGHAASLRELLDELGLARVTVVGHSLGGGVALAFAYLFPERVERLVLISSGGCGRELSIVLRAAILPGAGPLMRTLGARPVLAVVRVLAGGLAALGARRMGRSLAEVAITLERLADAGTRSAFLNTARSVIDHRGQKTLAFYTLATLRAIPLLVIWGARDRIIPPAHGEAITERHGHADLAVLDGAGHSPQLVQAPLIAERIARFIAPREDAPGPSAPAETTAA